ncbi:MAG: acyl-CoA dehydrogenase family protein [Bacteroidota bacterium]
MTDNLRVQQLIDWLFDFSNNRINYRLMDERRSIPPHVILEFGNHGIFGLQVPKDYDGQGFSNSEALDIYAYLGMMNVTLAAFIGQNNSLGIRPIVDFGSEQQKSRYLADLATGRKLASYALTEPHAGSFPNNMRGCIKTNTSQQYVLQAEKIYIGNIGWSSVVAVFTKHITANGKPGGFTACLLDTDKKGIKIGPEHLTMGLKSAIQNRVLFDQVQVQEEEILGQVGQSYKISHQAMQMSRMVIGAISVGAMKRCLFLMNRYANRRRIATGTMAAHPEIRYQLSEAMHKIRTIDCMVKFLGQRLDQGISTADEVFMIIKIMGSEFLWQTVDRALQILGGRGYMENNVISSFLRDARVLRIFEGPTETLHYFIGYLFPQKKLLQFLIKDVNNEALANRLRATHEELKDRSKQLTNLTKTEQTALLHSRMGMILSWACVVGILQYESQKTASSNLRSTLAWANYQLEQTIAVGMSQDYASTLIPQNAFDNSLAAFDRIDLEQKLEDEIWQIDPYLANAFDKNAAHLLLQNT